MRFWLLIKRKKLGLIQKDIADRVGISASMYSDIERGIKNPSGKVAYKIAKELRFDMKLFFQEEKKNKVF